LTATAPSAASAEPSIGPAAAGLKVRAELDERKYPKGFKVSELVRRGQHLAPRVPSRLELHDLTTATKSRLSKGN
jgi:hypothetical protein